MKGGGMHARKWLSIALLILVALGLTGLAVVGCGSGSKGFDLLTTVPILSSLSCNSGPPGTEVTLRGKGFGDGVSSRVEFAGTEAGVAEWHDDYIVVYVPSGSISGAVSVTTPGGTSNPMGFTVEEGST